LEKARLSFRWGKIVAADGGLFIDAMETIAV